MTKYDRWKLATPRYGDDECCEECFVTSMDNGYGVAEPEGCADATCSCHWTREQWKEAKGEAKYDAMRDDQLTEEK